MDTSRDAMEEEEESDEFLLLEKYCSRKKYIRLRGFSLESGGLPVTQGAGPPSSDVSLSNVVETLADIAESVPIADSVLTVDDSSPEHQQDLVEKLVVLLKKEGDDLNKKIQQNKVLQQQLQGPFSYSLFQRLVAALQGAWPTAVAAPGGPSAPSVSEARLRKEQIAWVFEVTKRLSTIDQIPKRRALIFGSRFLRQNHSAWVQQHGGWRGAFLAPDSTCPSPDLS